MQSHLSVIRLVGTPRYSVISPLGAAGVLTDLAEKFRGPETMIRGVIAMQRVHKTLML